MAGSILEQIFNRCYILMKLNLFFVGLTLIGGIVLGIGPAFYAVLSLFHESEWEVQGKTLKKAWQYYKEGFLRINKLSMIYLIAAVILGVNLFIAVKQIGLAFLSISLFIIFALMLILFLFSYSIQLDVLYDLTLKTNLQLSATLLFADFKEFLIQLMGNIMLLALTVKYPAMLLFFTFSLHAIWMNVTSGKRLTWLDKMLPNEGENG